MGIKNNKETELRKMIRKEVTDCFLNSAEVRNLIRKEISDWFKNSREVKSLTEKIQGLNMTQQSTASETNLPADENSVINEKTLNKKDGSVKVKCTDKKLNMDLLKIKHQIDECESSNKKLNKKICDLTEENERYKSKAIEMNEENKNLKVKIAELMTENRKRDGELKEAHKSIQEYRDIFKLPIDYLNMYRSLTDFTKKGLSNVICDKNEVLFIASCSDANSLKKIWEYTKEIISSNTREDDIEKLKKIFDFFFDIYNQSQPEPVYRRDVVNVGDEFDNDIHIRSFDGGVSGNITDVLLCGYSSVNTEKPICKSLVKI